MRIGLDGIALPQHFSGAAHYILNLVKNILIQPREFSVTVFCKPQHKILFEKYLQKEDEIQTVSLKNRIHQLYFYEKKLSRLLVSKNIKLFHSMHYICPPANQHYKLVTTFHDMGFITHPHYYPVYKTFFFARRIPVFIQRADCIVSVSKQTANDIKDTYAKSVNKIETIYPGTDHLPVVSSPPAGQKTILAVNTFEKRKNIPFLIDVFNRLSENLNSEYQFIIVGQKSNDFIRIEKKIEQSPNRNKIKVKINVSEEELVKLYRSADFFLNASEFEGFGFTTFEAIQQSCPAFIFKKAIPDGIISQHPYVMEELHAENWTNCIIKGIQSDFKDKINLKTIRHLSWENAALKIIDLYSGKINLPEK